MGTRAPPVRVAPRDSSICLPTTHSGYTRHATRVCRDLQDFKKQSAASSGPRATCGAEGALFSYRPVLDSKRFRAPPRRPTLDRFPTAPQGPKRSPRARSRPKSPRRAPAGRTRRVTSAKLRSKQLRLRAASTRRLLEGGALATRRLLENAALGFTSTRISRTTTRPRIQ